MIGPNNPLNYRPRKIFLTTSINCVLPQQMPRGRPKLSNEAKTKNRKETYHKYNTKRRIVGLDQHPNAFANLATSALREQYTKELEDGMVQPKISESKDNEIDYDPDEDLRGLHLSDDYNDGGRFAEHERGSQSNENDSDVVYPDSGFGSFNSADVNYHNDTDNAAIPKERSEGLEEPSNFAERRTGQKATTWSGITPRMSSNVY